MIFAKWGYIQKQDYFEEMLIKNFRKFTKYKNCGNQAMKFVT